MHTFRLCNAAFTALDGEGAKQYGGRWNFPGYPLVYTSSQLSLAILELLVHTNVDLIPKSLTCLEIEIPDNIQVVNLDLPKSYTQSKNESILKELGTIWLQQKQTAVMRVPSLVPIEYNILINPLHPASQKIHIVKQEAFHMDPRLLL